MIEMPYIRTSTNIKISTDRLANIKTKFGEAEQKLTNSAAGFLGKHMES